VSENTLIRCPHCNGLTPEPGTESDLEGEHPRNRTCRLCGRSVRCTDCGTVPSRASKDTGVCHSCGAYLPEFRCRVCGGFLDEFDGRDARYGSNGDCTNPSCRTHTPRDAVATMCHREIVSPEDCESDPRQSLTCRAWKVDGRCPRCDNDEEWQEVVDYARVDPFDMAAEAAVSRARQG